MTKLLAYPNPDLGLTDTQLKTPCAKLSLEVNGVPANGMGLIGTAPVTSRLTCHRRARSLTSTPSIQF